MKHLKEFHKFNWLTRPKKSGGDNILVVRVDNQEARVLAVAGLSKFLKSQGLEVKVLRTALVDEDYELELNPRNPLEDLFIDLPVSENEGNAEVEVFYKDAPEVKIKFLWTWMEGVHK
jgi:hypothetical protein